MEVVHTQQAQGVATVLAIGTAVPPVRISQDEYADFYFRITNNEHLTGLKEKMTRICNKSTIKQRYLSMMANDAESLRKSPSISKCWESSLDARQEILEEDVAKLGKEAAMVAIMEWNQPISKITHLIFCTNSSVNCPGADCQLVHLLGLSPTVKRVMLCYQGCQYGATVLRLAKDLAENNCDARILIVTSENLIHAFCGPCESNPEFLVPQALFGDGAAALIVGADPNLAVENSLYEIISAMETTIPDTMNAITMRLRQVGDIVNIAPSVPKHVSESIIGCVEEALKPFGITNLNSLFWIIHPGGPAILNQAEEKLQLDKEKLAMSRKVLADVGNLSGPTVLFIMDQMRKKSAAEGKSTTGHGFEFGILLAFGPGISVETLLLRACSI
ncbi:hypothetical protein LUZ63_018815 [Rhynchospora breviuscula]|uniref:chalcone synthase n=1 Tax=Rhynchospora breviuscula TaxID=2022672 RepID=A0A9Q0C5B6_9POAL|nr:hypothetical protein LUZ63_018815 [Rhynchospora breviuscula]